MPNKNQIISGVVIFIISMVVWEKFVRKFV